MVRYVMRTLEICLFVLAIPLGLNCAGSPQEIAPPVPAVEVVAAPVPEPPPPKVMAWRAVLERTGDAEKVVYLFGSVHVASSDAYPLDPVIEDAYAGSEALVVELDIDAVSQQEQVQLVLTKAALPPGETIKDRLSDETYKKLEEGLGRYGVPLHSLSRFKPWFAAITLVTLRITAAGFNPELGIDRYFLGKKDKKIIPLETPDSQLSLFDDMAPDVEELFLLDALGGSLVDEHLDQMMTAWEEGDAEGLEALMFKPLKDEPAFGPLYKRVFDDRNHAMAEAVVTHLETHDTLFVVVGAGHMVGPEGLVAIFEKQGYAVTQLEKTR